MKYYLINLDAKEICSSSDDVSELEQIAQQQAWAYHVCKEDFPGCTLMDLVHYYNNLPNTNNKIERFSDRNNGLRRLNAALELGNLCAVRTGKQAVKPRKKRSEGSNAGRTASWEIVAIAAAGKADDLRFHKENPRYRVFEVIKRREEVTRNDLIKFCEDSLSIKRPQVMGAVGKLLKRGLVKIK